MNEIIGALNKLTKTVTQTSGVVVKSTKLSMSLANEEGNLKSVYIEIGKKVHEIYLYGGNLGKFFDEKYAEITDIEKKIDEIKRQLDIVKGSKSCPKCNGRIERAAEFCQKCGFRMGDAALEIVPELEREAGFQSAAKCRVCGCDNPCDSKFCLSCGRIL